MHKCQMCNQQPATMKIVKMVNGQIEDYHVCEECAAGLSAYAAKIMKNAQADLKSTAHLLSDLIKGHEEGTTIPSGKAPRGTQPEIECPHCGLDFARYRQTYMLGCPHCYDAFGGALEADLLKIHGATTHTGGRTRTQETLADFQSRIKTLKHELEDAVQREDFDRAARLRDELRELQDAGTSAGTADKEA